MFRVRAALLSQCPLLSTVESTLFKPTNVAIAQHLTSLKQFSTNPQESPKPDPPTSSPKPEDEPSSSSNEQPKAPDNPLDALRGQIREQIMQFRASSTVLEQTAADPLPTWQRSLVDSFGAWFQYYFADFMRTKIEKDFDLNEFLEGSKDAFWIVHKLIGEEDYETLRTMVSKKLMDAVETTGKEYKAGGLVWRTEIDENVPLDAQLRRISLWTGQQIAEYDAEQAKLEPENVAQLPMPSGRWLVMWVQYKASQQTLITREEDGQVVAKLTDKRPALWTFAAGPLPENMPVQKLETPFWLLKFS